MLQAAWRPEGRGGARADRAVEPAELTPLLLAAQVAPFSFLHVRPIGVMGMLDQGERDDKVRPAGGWSGCAADFPFSVTRPSPCGLLGS